MAGTELPEWLYIGFSDGEWETIYHQGHLIACGEPSATRHFRGEYLDEVANGTRAAWQGDGRGALHLSYECETEYGLDVPVPWSWFTDRAAPATVHAGIVEWLKETKSARYESDLDLAQAAHEQGMALNEWLQEQQASYVAHGCEMEDWRARNLSEAWSELGLPV